MEIFTIFCAGNKIKKSNRAKNKKKSAIQIILRFELLSFPKYRSGTEDNFEHDYIRNISHDKNHNFWGHHYSFGTDLEQKVIQTTIRSENISRTAAKI